MNRHFYIGVLLAAAFCLNARARAEEPQTQPATAPSQSVVPGGAGVSPAHSDGDLTTLSLEDLMNVTVNSASKTDQNISQVAAAVTVIGQDQIHDSGLTSIPELLRLVPGMEVARVNANVWAVSARGFNSQFADKLLVLMDGRSLYDPNFSGAVWARDDTVLADLEKIEVIRGPGATLWGSNAVNGVINITTKSARDTQGLLIDGILGTTESDTSLRYGGMLDAETYYRVYGKFHDYNDFAADNNGDNYNDGWLASHGGFRIDRYPDEQNVFTAEGDFYNNAQTNSDSPQAGHVSENGSGENVLGRWTHTETTKAGDSIQVYYDGVNDVGTKFGSHRDTVDAEFQDNTPLGSAQELTWGLEAHDERIGTNTDDPVYLQGGSVNKYVASGFVQDDLTLVPDRLHVIGGSKFEYSNYDRFQYQPSGRALFTPDDRNTYWAAVSRAIRSPSTFDLGENNPFGALGADNTVSLGNRDIKPEVEYSYEAGYRTRATDSLTFDIDAFYSRYDQLTADALVPDGNTTIVNAANGYSYGVEPAAELKVTPDWRLETSYTLFFSHAHVDPGAVLDANNDVGANPHSQFQFHSYWDVTPHIEFSTSVYYVGAIEGVDPYTRVDTGVNWHINSDLEVGLVGQNLLEHRHYEFSSDNSGEPVPRSFYLRMTYSH